MTLAALPVFTNTAGSGVIGYGLEHQLDGGSWAVWTTGGPAYTSTPFGLYPEGTHGFRVWALDAAERRGWSTSQTVVADRTPPTVTLTLTERSDYAHVDGAALFYGLGSGGFTVTAALEDTLAGLAQVAFPDTTGPGITYTLSGVASATRLRAYTFSEGANEEGVYEVAASDRATNVGTAAFTLTRDTAPPAVWLDVPHRIYSGTASIPVAWGATDDGSGVARYDVQVRVEDGAWTAWLTGTLATEAAYALEEGEWFSFRVTATDNVSNAGSAEAASSFARVTKYYYHGGQRVAMRAGDVVYYLQGDHLGSTSLTTDGSGAVVARQLYHPYGTVRAHQGTLPTDFGFTGQRDVPGTGLVFMHARYYHPALGRFVSADTIVPQPGNPQDFNRYTYAANNPLKYTDPTGHTVKPPQRFRISLDISDWNPQVVQALDVVQEAARTVTQLPPVIAGPYTTARAFLEYVNVDSEAETMTVGNRDPVSATELALEMAGLSTVIGAPTSGLGEVADDVTSGMLRPGQAGRFGDLDALAEVGDDLTPHHMPQAALEWTPREDGGALMMTHVEHAQTRTFFWRGARSKVQDAGKPFRDVLAADIRDVRSIVGSSYSEGLLALINYYRTNFPNLMTK